jgi:hypothetical protein
MNQMYAMTEIKLVLERSWRFTYLPNSKTKNFKQSMKTEGNCGAK